LVCIKRKRKKIFSFERFLIIFRTGKSKYQGTPAFKHAFARQKYNKKELVMTRIMGYLFFTISVILFPEE